MITEAFDSLIAEPFWIIALLFFAIPFIWQYRSIFTSSFWQQMLESYRYRNKGRIRINFNDHDFLFYEPTSPNLNCKIKLQYNGANFAYTKKGLFIGAPFPFLNSVILIPWIELNIVGSAQMSFMNSLGREFYRVNIKNHQYNLVLPKTVIDNFPQK